MIRITIVRSSIIREAPPALPGRQQKFDISRSRAIAGAIALGRVGQPDDIANLVAFLASEAGGRVTGQAIDASGGQRL